MEMKKLFILLAVNATVKQKCLLQLDEKREKCVFDGDLKFQSQVKFGKKTYPTNLSLWNTQQWIGVKRELE